MALNLVDELRVMNEVVRLREQVAHLQDSLARSERAMSEAVLNWNLAGIRAQKAEAEVIRLEHEIEEWRRA